VAVKKRVLRGPGVMGTVSAAKKASKKTGGLVTTIPADGSLTARCLTEPDEWAGYYEFWSEDDQTYYPVFEGEELPDGARASFRYLLNVFSVDDNKPIVLKLPKTAGATLIAYYEKYGTLLDRDYEFSKSGSGIDTKYLAAPDSPSPMNIKRYKTTDLAEVLEKMAAQADESDDDEDEDEDDVPVSKASAKPKSSRFVDEDDEDDEPAPRRHVVKRKPIRKPTR